MKKVVCCLLSELDFVTNNRPLYTLWDYFIYTFATKTTKVHFVGVLSLQICDRNGRSTLCDGYFSYKLRKVLQIHASM